MTLQLELELSKNIENELEKISKKSNCTIQQYLENGFSEYMEQVLDIQLIEKLESYENEHGMNYYTADRALKIMDKIDSGEFTDEDVKQL